jgi:internalin A
LHGKDISFLKELNTDLQGLNLSGMDITNLSELQRFQNLHNLCLLACKGVMDFAPLSKLERLRSLHLSFTSVTDLAPLQELSGLQDLYLSDTKVTDLGPLQNLHNLSSLDLGQCVGVIELEPLATLPVLKNLNLSKCSALENLAPLTKLKELQTLLLAFCENVTDISSLAGHQRLQNLDLSFCRRVIDLTPLTSVQGLRELNIYGCSLAITTSTLKILADLPSLADLKVHEAVGIPQEVLSQNSEENCLPRLLTYFSEVNFSVEAENELKVILLGNGRVGKTQLCRRFRGESFDASVPSTHGVQIWREELRLKTTGQETAFQVNWWDFGGQDIYHGTHALFLRNRAVFLILWNPAFEDRREFSESGLVLRNQPLAYWLDYVRSLAGKDSPVIVVQSKCDTFADRRPTPSRPDGFEFFESCSFSAKTDLGRETLEGQLRDAMRYLLERNGALEIGKGRAEVRGQLYAWRSEDQQRRPEDRKHRLLSLDEFQGLCDEIGGVTSWEHALDYFHQTGVVFYRPDLFRRGSSSTRTGH